VEHAGPYEEQGRDDTVYSDEQRASALGDENANRREGCGKKSPANGPEPWAEQHI